MDTKLTPLAKKIREHAAKLGGSISAREALLELDITSASLARRVTEMVQKGFYVRRERRKHQANGKQYTRYHMGVTA